MRTPWLALACAVTAGAGCQTSGSVDLTLDLPTTTALKPTGMTSVTVTVTGSDGIPISTTSQFGSDGTFSAGDIPVQKGVQLDVLLRDVSNRLVGIGEAAARVDISGTTTTAVDIPVRRPFVYAATPTALVSFDPSLDSRDPAFQGTVAGISAPLFAISVGGDRLAVVSSLSVQAIDTSTNALAGKAVTLPGPANDATAVPGTHQVAVAYASGIAIVDLDSGSVAMTSGAGSVDRVTVGADASGTMTAYGLVGRVAAPIGPLETCAKGTSAIVSVPVDSPGTFAMMQSAAALSDIAADPAGGMLFATAPCTGKVESVDSTGQLTDIASLERAAVLSVLGGRVWAAGSHPSTPVCLNPNADPETDPTVPCTLTSDESCPPPTAAVDSFIGYVSAGANLIVDSIPEQSGDDPITFDVPARTETIVNTDDDAQQHAEVLNTFAAEPVDLVALPGGQYVSLVVSSSYFIQQLGDTRGDIILPCLKATTGDWLLMDMASVSIADRVRTSCQLVTGPSDDEFMNWACDVPVQQETSTQGDYQPTSVGALFGAR